MFLTRSREARDPGAERKKSTADPQKYDRRHNPFEEFREDCLVCELARLCRAGWVDEVGAPILLSKLTRRLSRAAGHRNR
jgi:hypothetical protein